MKPVAHCRNCGRGLHNRAMLYCVPCWRSTPPKLRNEVITATVAGDGRKRRAAIRAVAGFFAERKGEETAFAA